MTRRDDLDTFIEKATVIHYKKYDYTLVEYINSRTKIKIKCNNCNIIIETTPSTHLQSNNCANCINY